MSAVSPMRTARNVPTTVPPQAVSDRTLLDNVTGFINDVTLTNLPQLDPKDVILWARFETIADIADPTYGEDWDLEGGIAPPLLLLLGYGTGVQCWAIPANGEAIEVLSWRNGSVRALRVLPLPFVDGGGSAGCDELADGGLIDLFGPHRPLMAICDASANASGPAFCNVNFISLRSGEQVKTIKFKNPIIDILANRSVVVVTFAERIAVFDANTLEDRLTVTTCHPGTSVNPNPVVLGPRWMAYAERKLLPSKRSSGGCDCDGVASYTATVLNAAKSLGKGLRELGEQMAAGFTGNAAGNQFGISGSSGGNGAGGSTDDIQSGIVTVMDIKYSIKDSSPTTGAPISTNGADPIVAHFIAHSDAIVAMTFDCSGMLIATADKRGHDFHVFRIQPHPAGPSLSAVHHLYVLHRGDTTAKVQDMVFSLDSRWIAVSTLRGTTHVFPVTSYGGPAGVRTHGSPHVVNRLSRFHRSAGLSVEGRSGSPVHTANVSGVSEIGALSQISNAYTNPRVPPFPHPTVVLPLAQLRQPSSLAQSSTGSAVSGHKGIPQSTRQRLTSLSDDTGAKPLRVCATFARARAWLLDPPGTVRDSPTMRMQRKAVESLFIMAGHGALIQYDLEPKTNINIPKDKVCDDTSIELDTEPRAQWILSRKDASPEVKPPLAPESWLLKDRLATDASANELDTSGSDALSAANHSGVSNGTDWLSQVEIITHAGPHRRLWMGPQFMFKTYNTPSGAPLSHIDSEAVEVGITSTTRPARSNPMNMPLSGNGRSAVPVLIESGSFSSYEQSPRLIDQYKYDHMGSDFSIGGVGDSQLREDLADAMRESPGRQSRDSGLTSTGSVTTASSGAANSGICTVIVSVAKVVNPLGTVTTVRHPLGHGADSAAAAAAAAADDLDQFSYTGDGDEFIHENCDEGMFRPMVAVYTSIEDLPDESVVVPPAQPSPIGQELIVPVIEKNVDDKRTAAAKKVVQNVPRADFDDSAIPNRQTKNNISLEEAQKETVNLKARVEPTPPLAKERKKSDTRKPKFSETHVEKKESKKTTEKNKKKGNVEVVGMAEPKEATPPPTLAPTMCSVETDVFVTKISKKSQRKLLKTEESARVDPPSDTVSSSKSSVKEASLEPVKATKVKVIDQKQASPPPPPSSQPPEPVKVRKLAAKVIVLDEKSKQNDPPPPPELEIDTTYFSHTELAVPLEDNSTSITLPPPHDKVKKSDSVDEVTNFISDLDHFQSEIIDSDQNAAYNVVLKPTQSQDQNETAVGGTKKSMQSERSSKKQKKTTTEKCVKQIDTVDMIAMNVNECSSEECSSIQDSIFLDPIVSTTFVMKKSTVASSKPSFADMFNNPKPLLISTESPDEPVDPLPPPYGLDFQFSMPLCDMSSNENVKDDAFAPLEPFELNFDQLHINAQEFDSLINFQSPLGETASKPLAVDEPATESSSSSDDKKYSLCSSSFQKCDAYEEDDGDDDDDDDEPPVLLYECQDSDYKSLEQEIDETYLSLELPAPIVDDDLAEPKMADRAYDDDQEANKTSSSSSNDDTEDSFSQMDREKADVRLVSEEKDEIGTETAALTAVPYKREDDEELQPLIGLTVSQEEEATSKTYDAADTSNGASGSAEPDDEGNTANTKPQPTVQPATFGNKKKNKKKRR